MKKENKSKNSTFLRSRTSSNQGLVVNEPWNVDSVQAMSVQSSALHKANLIKINKINNILLLDNTFNAKMDSVHYDNNKLILENSKFLNKLKIKKSNNSNLSESTSTSKQLIRLESSISLKDSSLSLTSTLSKGIATITELIKPKILMRDISSNRSLFNLNQESNKNKIYNFSLQTKVNLSSLTPGLSIERVSAKSKIQNKNPKLEDGKNFNSFDLISSYLSTPEGKSVAINMAKAQAARAALKLQGSVDETQVIDEGSLAKGNKTKDTSFKINKKKVASNLEVLNTKVDMASLNKIKSSSTITQKVYDSITSPNIQSREGGVSGREEKKSIIHKYLTYITKSNSHININPNLSKKFGILLNYNRTLGYTFLNKNLDTNKKTNLISEYLALGDIYKLLFYFFKSIYCIISKPTILFSPDKITIRLFYYLVIPKKKVLKLFGIYYLKSMRDEWMQKRVLRPSYLINYYKKKSKSSLTKESNINSKLNFESISKVGRVGKAMNDIINNNIKKIRLPFMKFKVRKVISRLKSKSPRIRNVYIDLRKFNIVKVFHNKFLLLTKILSSLFKKPIVLEITRIHNFKYDSNILANAIQFVVKNKRKNPRVAINKVYRKKNIKLLNDPNLTPRNKIITFLSGLNIYINGRLMREPIIPRITTKKFEKGASARGKVNYIDTSYITKKNRKGAYTIKVKSAQNFL